MSPYASPSSRFVRSVRLLAAAVLAAAPLVAQTWVQRSPAASPPARSNSPAAYDIARGVTTVFGGFDGSAARSDTWEWSGTAWTQRTPTVRPSARWGHGLAHDAKRGRTVLFGGYDGAAMRGDTWEWDGTAWTQRTTAVAPTPRGFFSMAYDGARGVCVLYGGQDQNIGTLGDTWEWDGAAWTQRTTANAPGPRRGMAMAFDEARREMVAFGGNDGLQVLGGTWTYDGVNWTQRLPAASPSPRWLAASAYDGNCGRMMLLGGADAGSNSLPAGSWTWDGLTWTAFGGTQPAARHATGLAHDAQRGGFVAFGGRGSIAFLADTWELAASCSRTMATLEPAVVGRTAQFRYDYPAGSAAYLHFGWTLITPRMPAALPLAIPGFPSIGLCRVDLLNQLAAPATFLDGGGALTTPIAIPNNLVFSGFQFDVQAMDLDFFTLTLRWAANDVEVTVGPTVVPTPDFTATPTSGNAPLTVQFTDLSTQYPTAWQWDFNNDGLADSTQQNPSWTYAFNGVYSVRLVATNAIGSASVTRTSLIIVGPVSPNPQLNLVPIAPGTFTMGSTAGQSNEQPVRQVTLTRPFWIGKYEVTQAEYQAVMGNNPSVYQGANAPNAPQRPVESVDELSARAYCAQLNAIESAAGRVPPGYHYRLPTEAEWEYCCRAGTTSEWHTGASLTTAQANFGGALANTTYTSGQTAVVGSYAPNAWGLHDMHGNVAEWCLDKLLAYPPGPATDPLGYDPTSLQRVFRGGSSQSSSTATNCRSASRQGGLGSFGQVGLRVVLAPLLYSSPPETPALTATPTIGQAPLTVQFTGTSFGALSWQWDFDNDGTIDSTQQNPSWTYASNGVYSVRLVTTNNVGATTTTRIGLIAVGFPGPAPGAQLNMAPIAPGTFTMGSLAGAANEQPLRQVTLSRPFWIGRHEVTQAQYQALIGGNPSFFKGANVFDAPQRPVENLNWATAVAYCQALTASETAAGRVPAGYQYRLPTEAEWEYCCRAGTTTEWHTGTSLSTIQANFNGVRANAAFPNGQTAPVGLYAPNAWGLHDMHGNVQEWVLDALVSYAPGAVTDPYVTTASVTQRVLRGGSWSSGITATGCRSAYRQGLDPNGSVNSNGFRVVLAPIVVP